MSLSNITLDGLLWTGHDSAPQPAWDSWMPEPFTPEYATFLAEHAIFLTGGQTNFISGYKAALRNAEDGFILSAADFAYARDLLMPIKEKCIGDGSVCTSTFEIACYDHSNKYYPLEKPIILVIHGRPVNLAEPKDSIQLQADSSLADHQYKEIIKSLLNPGSERYTVRVHDDHSPADLSVHTREFAIVMEYDYAQQSREICYFRQNNLPREDYKSMPLAFARTGFNQARFQELMIRGRNVDGCYWATNKWSEQSQLHKTLMTLPQQHKYEIQAINFGKYCTKPAKAEDDAIFAIVKKPRGSDKAIKVNPLA